MQSAPNSAEDVGPGPDLRLGRLGLEVGEDVHAGSVEVAAHLVGDPSRLAVDVGDDQELRPP